MRGADKSVKQFQVSRKSLVAAPAAAVLAVSGCIVGLQLKSHYEIEALEGELHEQSAEFAQTVTDKDDIIAFLQQEVDRLSVQEQQLKSRMDSLQQLESRLKSFIEKYGQSEAEAYSGLPRESSASKSTLGASTALESRRIASLDGASARDWQEMSTMMDTLEQTMANTLKQAQKHRAAVDATPSGWPTRSHMMTSGFGYRKDPFTGRSTFHAGVDITGEQGDPVYAAAEGTVTESDYDSAKGHYIVIDHLGGLQSVYMHLSDREAETGDAIRRGERIGQLGSTGRSTGPHLHFQIMQHDEAVNPLKYLRLVKED